MIVADAFHWSSFGEAVFWGVVWFCVLSVVLVVVLQALRLVGRGLLRGLEYVVHGIDAVGVRLGFWDPFDIREKRRAEKIVERMRQRFSEQYGYDPLAQRSAQPQQPELPKPKAMSHEELAAWRKKVTEMGDKAIAEGRDPFEGLDFSDEELLAAGKAIALENDALPEGDPRYWIPR